VTESLSVCRAASPEEPVRAAATWLSPPRIGHGVDAVQGESWALVRHLSRNACEDPGLIVGLSTTSMPGWGDYDRRSAIRSRASNGNHAAPEQILDVQISSVVARTRA
jgi:hypothetical protein